MPEPLIGKPLPLGVVDAKGVHEIAPTPEPDAIEDQLASLRQQVEELREKLASIGKKTVAAVEAHPFIAAAAVSVGLWALLAVTARGVGRRFP